jgi:hypothetical protein
MTIQTQALALLILVAAFPHPLKAEDHSPWQRHRVTLADPGCITLDASDATGLPQWATIRRITELLQTDEGALTFLHENPLLASQYAADSYFLDYVAKWRPRVPVLPYAQDSEEESDSTWCVIDGDGTRATSVTFHHPVPENAITILTIRWEDQQIASLTFMRGFENVTPRRHRLNWLRRVSDYPDHAQKTDWPR